MFRSKKRYPGGSAETMWRYILILLVSVGGCVSKPEKPVSSPAEKKILWQKMQKQRSVRNEWIEPYRPPSEPSRTAAATPAPSVPVSETLTLSPSGLVALDWFAQSHTGAQVVGKRIVGELGVEFDIRFPSNSPGHRAIKYVSTGAGGRGALIGIDTSAYKTFALKFTLVSIDGAAEPGLAQQLELGAVIGSGPIDPLRDGTPVTLSFASQKTTAVSTTPVQTGKIWQIGIYAHMVNPADWSASGSTVTILVEPVEGAAVLR